MADAAIDSAAQGTSALRSDRAPTLTLMLEAVAMLLEEPADDEDIHWARKWIAEAQELHAAEMAERLCSVKMPVSADEAALMALLGERWLRDNAPPRLRPIGEPEHADPSKANARDDGVVGHGSDQQTPDDKPGPKSPSSPHER